MFSLCFGTAKTGGILHVSSRDAIGLITGSVGVYDMKILLALIIGGAFGSFATPSIAQETWLLVGNADSSSMVATTPNGLRAIVDMGHALAYGESAKQIAFLSGRAPGSYSLDVVDKALQKRVSHLLLNGHPAGMLAGPYRGIVLTDDTAYFLTAYVTDHAAAGGNALGGAFEFNKVTITGGKQQTVPLPKDCKNPRLADFNGVALIYEWNGVNVWKFEAGSNTFDWVVSGQYVTPALIDERTAEAAKTLPRAAFADYVAVVGAGVFRLSKVGKLYQVLDENLATVPVPGKSLDLGPMGSVTRVLRTFYNGQPAIGLVARKNGQTVFAYVDPRNLTIEFQAVLTNNIVPESVYAPPGGAVYYVDRDSSSIMRTSTSGTVTEWKLAQQPTPIDLFDTRILFVENDQHH